MNKIVATEMIRLVACDERGCPVEPLNSIPSVVAEHCAATAELYRRIGFVPPWIGYVSVFNHEVVGGGAFVGAPVSGEVEIVYYTLPPFERRGFAKQTAGALVKIARDSQPDIVIIAKTLPMTNASTQILERLGFMRRGTAFDADVGEAWLWRQSTSEPDR